MRVSSLNLHNQERGQTCVRAGSVKIRSQSGKSHVTGHPAKKSLKPVRRRETVSYLREAYPVTIRRACEVAITARSSYHYRSRKDRQNHVRMPLRDLAYSRVSYGYRRLHILLQREGWMINHKRVYGLLSSG